MNKKYQTRVGLPSPVRPPGEPTRTPFTMGSDSSFHLPIAGLAGATAFAHRARIPPHPNPTDKDTL